MSSQRRGHDPRGKLRFRKTGRAAVAPTAVLLTVGLSLAGCVDRFFRDIDTPPTPTPQPTVEAYVLPGDTALVYVSTTYGLADGREPRLAEGADVTLQFDGGTPVPLEQRRFVARDDDDRLVEGFYYRVFVPEPLAPAGARVRLAVELPNGETLGALSYVPQAAGRATIARASTDEYQGAGTVAVELDDQPGEDFFLVRGVVEGVHPVYDTLGRTIGLLPFRTAVRFREGYFLNARDYGTRAFADDRAFDGARGRFTYQVSEPQGFVDTAQITYTLAPLAPDGYAYLRDAELAARLSENPLVEPVIVSSNVEGGLGGLVVAGAPQRFVFEAYAE